VGAGVEGSSPRSDRNDLPRGASGGRGLRVASNQCQVDEVAQSGFEWIWEKVEKLANSYFQD
jgi:hypothetical protein